jgi:N-acetylglucosaminyl-diphospho-decaprenol L-rhamnosyltransferase
MNTVRVCAIILDYFGADKSEICLKSLIGQGIEKICLVDNSTVQHASTNLHAAVNRVRTNADYEIEIFTTGENLGFAKGVNYALDHEANNESPHDYYLIINNDAVAGPGLVSGLVSALQKEPRAALAAPRVVSSDPSREYGIWYHRYLGLLLSRPGRFRFHYFTGCCLLLPHHMVHQTRLFDEKFFMYGEDTDLGWRLTRQGKKMLCTTEVFVEHEYGPSVDRCSFFYEYHMARAHLLLSWKTWRHPVEIPLLLVCKIIGLAGRAVIRCLKYRTLNPVATLFISWLPLRLHKAERQVDF